MKRLPAPRGNGFWSQEIYYHLLNCGLRLPPTAGSASGVLPNPVGYNRVYVYMGKSLDYSKWWQGLKAGRAFVTNGPLLICRAERELPGHVFQSATPLPIKLTIDLASNDPVSGVELVCNGRVIQTVPCDPAAQTQQRTVSVTFDRSGWFLLRAIADNPRTFRFGSTAPFYLEIGSEKQCISRASAEFFVEWVKQRMGRIQLKEEAQRREVLRYHEQALKFWQQKAAAATAE